MPTLVFNCGAECGVNGIGSAPGTGGVRHWDASAGTFTVDTGTVHGGARSYKFAAAGAANNLQKTIVGAPNHGVLRVAVRFETLPSTNCSIAAFTTSGSFAFLGFIAATSKLCVSAVGSLSPRQESTNAISAGVWYVVDFHIDMHANPWVFSWAIDGTAQTGHSPAVAASTIAAFKVGGIAETVGGTPTYNLFVDDIAISTTSGDYPIGAGVCVGLFPNADGTHSFNAAGDFKYENATNVAVGATDTNTHVNSPLDTTIGNFISVNAASNTEYVEWQFGDTPSDVSSINGVQVTMASHAATTTADKQTLRLNDGGTLNDVCTDLDQSQTTICYHSKHYALAPSSGAAWTKTKVDALRARWNSSYGTIDESPVPFVDGVVFEVDYVQAADRRAVVTWTELEVPDEPRRSIVTWAELETPDEPRRSIVTWAELETPDAPRRSIVTWAELEVPDLVVSDRRAIITWAELETPPEPRRAVLTWTELETPNEPRRAVLTWAELETPPEPRRAIVTWAELEAPDAVSTDRRAIITWSELETPDAPRRAVITWSELEVPDAGGTDRRAIISFVEAQFPDPPQARGQKVLYEWTMARRAIVGHAILEVPLRHAAQRLPDYKPAPIDKGRFSRPAKIEIELPGARRVLVGYALLEVPEIPEDVLALVHRLRAIIADQEETIAALASQL